jgi:hypothetical protein
LVRHDEKGARQKFWEEGGDSFDFPDFV